LFDALDYKELKVFFDASDISDLSLQGVYLVLVGVDLFLEGVAFGVFLVAALDVPPDLPSVSLAVISLQLLDVVLQFSDQLALVTEQGLVVGCLLGQLS
jgi:hypothetical protein